MPTTQQMRDAVLAYASFFEQGDVEAIVALFTEDAVFEDPVGQPAHVGHEAIRAFFKAGFAAVNGSMVMIPEGEVRVAERHAACAMRVTCSKAHEPFWIATLDAFTFNQQGLFTHMQAFWGPENFHPLE